MFVSTPTHTHTHTQMSLPREARSPKCIMKAQKLKQDFCRAKRGPPGTLLWVYPLTNRTSLPSEASPLFTTRSCYLSQDFCRAKRGLLVYFFSLVGFYGVRTPLPPSLLPLYFEQFVCVCVCGGGDAGHIHTNILTERSEVPFEQWKPISLTKIFAERSEAPGTLFWVCSLADRTSLPIGASPPFTTRSRYFREDFCRAKRGPPGTLFWVCPLTNRTSLPSEASPLFTTRSHYLSQDFCRAKRGPPCTLFWVCPLTNRTSLRSEISLLFTTRSHYLNQDFCRANRGMIVSRTGNSTVLTRQQMEIGAYSIY